MLRFRLPSRSRYVAGIFFGQVRTHIALPATRAYKIGGVWRDIFFPHCGFWRRNALEDGVHSRSACKNGKIFALGRSRCTRIWRGPVRVRAEPGQESPDLFGEELAKSRARHRLRDLPMTG